MGAYTGNGEVVSRSESVTSLKSFYWYGAHSIQQKCVQTVTRIAGVTKARADTFHSSRSMSMVSGGSGALAWIVADAEGTAVDVAVSQMDNSNLYEVIVTQSVYTAWHAKQNVRPIA